MLSPRARLPTPLFPEGQHASPPPSPPSEGAKQLTSPEWVKAWRSFKAFGDALIYAFFQALNPWPCSNHALTPFNYQHNRYDSVEHAYLAMQAIAYQLPSVAAEILSPKYANLPKFVKTYFSKHAAVKQARQNNALKRNWTSRKPYIMRQLVLAKFEQNPEAAQALMQTKDSFMVEASPDMYWGCGHRPNSPSLYDGPANQRWGRNQLGRILMKVRDLLRARYTAQARAALPMQEGLVAYAVNREDQPLPIVPLSLPPGYAALPPLVPCSGSDRVPIQKENAPPIAGFQWQPYFGGRDEPLQPSLPGCSTWA